jgi:hypothetical protein
MPLLATGTTIAFVVGLALLGFMSDRWHPGANQSGTLKVPVQQGPLPFGVKTSASAAAASLNFRIPFPDVALANSSNLADLWADSVNQQFAATYSTGVTMTIKPNEYSPRQRSFPSSSLDKCKGQLGQPWIRDGTRDRAGHGLD